MFAGYQHRWGVTAVYHRVGVCGVRWFVYGIQWIWLHAPLPGD